MIKHPKMALKYPKDHVRTHGAIELIFIALIVDPHEVTLSDFARVYKAE